MLNSDNWGASSHGEYYFLTRLRPRADTTDLVLRSGVGWSVRSKDIVNRDHSLFADTIYSYSWRVPRIFCAQLYLNSLLFQPFSHLWSGCPWQVS